MDRKHSANVCHGAQVIMIMGGANWEGALKGCSVREGFAYKYVQMYSLRHDLLWGRG